MKIKSITFKSVLLITVAFLIMAVSVIVVADYQLRTIIDRSQTEVFSEKLATILGSLDRKYQRLQDTMMIEAYEEDFKQSFLTAFRNDYYNQNEQLVYPFIVDDQGRYVAHPLFERGDDTHADLDCIKRLVADKQGSFEYVFNGQEQWMIFKHFEGWNWTVAYTVPKEVKYADARLFRNILILIMAVTTALVLMIWKDQVIGVIDLLHDVESQRFTQANLELLTLFANHVAIAVENARLYEEAQKEITERKRAEEELRKHREHLEKLVEERTAELDIAMEQAQEADRLKSAFLASMSHELRTPLNSIIGFTGILLQDLVGPLNDEQTKQLGMVRDSSRHLLNLINDVLDISRIEAGQLEIVSEPFDMRQAVEKVVRTVTPLAEKKGLALVAEVAPEVGQITSDRRRVEQVLINLVNNAVKFTEKGEVRVECQVNDGWLVTRVVDTGIGIKPQDMDTLFKAFWQIESGLGRRREGTGLGLSICQKLVEMLGGEIWAESEWGVGSTFTFTLPSGVSL